jgi:hypothetical protein
VVANILEEVYCLHVVFLESICKIFISLFIEECNAAQVIPFGCAIMRY